MINIAICCQLLGLPFREHMRSASQKDSRGQGVTLRTSWGCRDIPAPWSLMSLVIGETWEELDPCQRPTTLHSWGN